VSVAPSQHEGPIDPGGPAQTPPTTRIAAAAPPLSRYSMISRGNNAGPTSSSKCVRRRRCPLLLVGAVGFGVLDGILSRLTQMTADVQTPLVNYTRR